MIKIGLGFLYLLPLGYVLLMHWTEQEIDWHVCGFVLAMAIFLTLLATVFKKYLEDTQDNRDMAVKIIKKVAQKSIHSDR